MVRWHQTRLNSLLGCRGLVRLVILLLAEFKAIIVVLVSQVRRFSKFVDAGLEAGHETDSLLLLMTEQKMLLVWVRLTVSVNEKEPIHVLRLALNVLFVLSRFRQLVDRVARKTAECLSPFCQLVVRQMLAFAPLAALIET